jgi:hypothetical protein
MYTLELLGLMLVTAPPMNVHHFQILEELCTTIHLTRYWFRFLMNLGMCPQTAYSFEHFLTFGALVLLSIMLFQMFSVAGF